MPDPRDCAYCIENTGDKDPERVEYVHEVCGVAIVCRECGARGPEVEGMENAAAVWNTYQIGYKKV